MKSSMSPLYHSSEVSAKKEQEKQSGFDVDFRGKKSTPASAALRTSDAAAKKGSAAAAAQKKLESKPSMDINESAELFINKFKQQLLIQRLESIENYEQMLARGT